MCRWLSNGLIQRRKGRHGKHRKLNCNLQYLELYRWDICLSITNLVIRWLVLFSKPCSHCTLSYHRKLRITPQVFWSYFTFSILFFVNLLSRICHFLNCIICTPKIICSKLMYLLWPWLYRSCKHEGGVFLCIGRRIFIWTVSICQIYSWKAIGTLNTQVLYVELFKRCWNRCLE